MKQQDFNMIFSSFVFFVSFVVVDSVSNAELRINYQQRDTLRYLSGFLGGRDLCQF